MPMNCFEFRFFSWRKERVNIPEEGACRDLDLFCVISISYFDFNFIFA